MARDQGPTRIERLGPADLMFLAVQGRPVPEQFGVLLTLSPRGDFDVAAATRLLGQRVGTVPRLRQRVVRVPPFCGRPIWADDPTFTVGRHVRHIGCPPPGDEEALLRIAADLVTRHLPTDRPLWTATFVTGLPDGRVGLVIVVQHALADGIGGLAVLEALLDGSRGTGQGGFPCPAPPRRRLVLDSLRRRRRAVAALPGHLGGLLGGLLGRAGRRPRAPRVGRAAPCALLTPTGPRRRLGVVRVPLDAVRRAGRPCGATLNDVVLTAVSCALHDLLGRRGQSVPAVVVAVPVGTRTAATARDLGNEFLEVRAALPGGPDPVVLLPRVAEVMRGRKTQVFRPPTGVIASLAVRAAVAVGLYGWYMRRQRYLHTVVTNVRGPERMLSFGGAPVTDVVPLAVGGENLAVTFAALSYAGSLAITLTVDPDAVPDLDLLTESLGEALRAPARDGSRPAPR